MSFIYVIKEGFSGFRRARLAAFTSITALMISVLLLGVLARVAWNGYELAKMVRTQIDMEVFLMEMDGASTQNVRRQLSALPIIQSLTYVSKDSAASRFRREFGAEGLPLADLDFLPASFILKFKPDVTSDSIRTMLPKIEAIRGIDEVSFNMNLLEMIENRLETLLYFGIGMGFLILITALVLVFNTIRLTIYAKQTIIKAMKLVGATNGFIRRPFLVEGMLQGMIAAVIAIGIVWLVFQILIPSYIPQIGVLEWPFSRWYYLTGSMALLAMLMGLFGSRWAARKFIRDSTIS